MPSIGPWKLGISLSLVGLAVAVWVVAERTPESDRHVAASAATTSARGHADDSNVERRAVSRDTGRPDLLLPQGLTADSQALPQRLRKKFRQLPANRDPDLEADPQFQKLVEMDAARKMALVAKSDPEESKAILAEMRNPSAKIERHIVERALLDPNVEVRLAALAEISLEMDEPPLDLLAPVVDGDPNPDVRLEALEIVGESESDEATSVINTALNDPDARVRLQAEDLLDDRADDPAM